MLLTVYITAISHQLVSSYFPDAVFHVVCKCFSAMVSHVVSSRFLSHAFVIIPSHGFRPLMTSGRPSSLSWVPMLCHTWYQLVAAMCQQVSYLYSHSGWVPTCSSLLVFKHLARADWLATDFNWMAPAALSNVSWTLSSCTSSAKLLPKLSSS